MPCSASALGLGGALARRFAREGWRVAAIARSDDKVRALADEIGGRGYTADVTDADAIRTVLARIRDELGPVHTLLWNVGSGVFGTLDDVDETGLDRAFDTNARGLLVAVQAIVGDLRAAGEGNIVVTGATASRRGKPVTTAFAPGKAAQRSLAEALARQLWPEGIHVALVVVDGVVDLPATRARMDQPDDFFVSPDAFADTVLFLCRQDRRAWTFELEVRPYGERW
ncbi:MAG: SDR family NAD(P)-dependent oxidoreductase [Myxococcota bacterium]